MGTIVIRLNNVMNYILIQTELYIHNILSVIAVFIISIRQYIQNSAEILEVSIVPMQKQFIVSFLIKKDFILESLSIIKIKQQAQAGVFNLR